MRTILGSLVLVFLTINCFVSHATEDRKVQYLCEDTKKIETRYFVGEMDAQVAVVTIALGLEINLKAVPAASGSKFSDGKYTW